MAIFSSLLLTSRFESSAVLKWEDSTWQQCIAGAGLSLSMNSAVEVMFHSPQFQLLKTSIFHYAARQLLILTQSVMAILK